MLSDASKFTLNAKLAKTASLKFFWSNEYGIEKSPAPSLFKIPSDFQNPHLLSVVSLN